MEQIFSNTTLTVNQLIEKIDTGELGLPELQRPFIWKDSKVRDLFDSLMRGYPIGYLMILGFLCNESICTNKRRRLNR